MKYMDLYYLISDIYDRVNTSLYSSIIYYQF